MGLFDRWQKNEDKIVFTQTDRPAKQSEYPIVCPYCFNEFDAEDALFRAARCEPEEYITDVKLDKFWELLTGESRGDVMPIIDPNELSEGHKTRLPQGSPPGVGVVVELETKYGRTTTRICPECHNALPLTAGRTPSNIISIVGGTSVGKTVFMTVLLETLRNRTQNNFDASGKIIENDEGFKALRQNLFKRGELAEATTAKYQKPLIFNWSWLDRSLPDITISFFDFPGEAINNPDFHNIQANHIKNASGIILLLDPTQFDIIAERVRNNGIIVENAKRRTASDVITDLWKNVFGIRADSMETSPTAVVITKSDVLKELATSTASNPPSNSNIFRDYVHKDYLNLDEVRNLHHDVQEFFNHYEPSLINDIKTSFKDHCFFAISSLGYDPEGSFIENVVSPLRVDEPFLWLLYRLGFIKGGERRIAKR
jgi:GTPase SAR1 family protein